MKKISVVIPCYNSEKYLETTVEKIEQVLAGRDYEIILVNDSSKDHTVDTICRIVDHSENVTGIDLAHNSGQHNATMAGFHYVSGDYVLTAADDGQTPVEKWPEMLAALEQGYDVSTVNYTDKGKRSLLRRMGSALSKGVAHRMLDSLDEGWVAFEFAAKRFVVDEMIRYQGPYASLDGLVLRVTHNINIIPCPQHKRRSGKSGYTLHKLLKLFTSQATTFSIKPLRLASIVGIIFAFTGIVLGLIVIINRIFGGTFLTGSASTLVLLIGLGLVMQMLGIIGEYIGRMYMVMNHSPQFVVRKEIRKDRMAGE